jgi:class 3 adenylate cyclase
VAIAVRIDRPRCIGAGNCISLAPTVFDWLPGDFAKAAVLDVDSVDEEVVRQAVLACPTAAIELAEIGELLPWQLRTPDATPRQVVKTFMFTDIVGSTSLAEVLGDEAWQTLLGWHDEALRTLFAQYRGHEVVATGDGFFIDFDSVEDAVGCGIAIQRLLAQHRKEQGFAPQVRIGLHRSDAHQVGQNYRGVGVNEAARIAGEAKGSEILASAETVADTRFHSTDPRSVQLKGLSQPVQVVTVDWR